jgi:Tol biopolymer transport system component
VELGPVRGGDPDLVGHDPPDVTGENVSDDGPWRLSENANGTGGDAPSWNATISGDGRWVAFQTDANDLSPTLHRHALLVDLLDRATLKVIPEIPFDGQLPNSAVHRPMINAAGTHVAFFAHASNLVAGDTNGVADYFVLDLKLGAAERVSVSSEGVQGNGPCHQAVPGPLTPDGRYVVFESDATNLVQGDQNGHTDIFRHDRITGSTVRVNVSSSGEEAKGPSITPSISDDGRFVVFASEADTLVVGDTNSVADVFLRDLTENTTTRISVGANAGQADGASRNPFISSDGSLIVFQSQARDLVPSPDPQGYFSIYLKERVSGTIKLISQANGEAADNYCAAPFISGDNRFVAFYSSADNLVPVATDNMFNVFVVELATGRVELVSTGMNGEAANGDSRHPALSHDGGLVVFESDATNLVPDDNNNYEDVFVFER